MNGSPDVSKRRNSIEQLRGGVSRALLPFAMNKIDSLYDRSTLKSVASRSSSSLPSSSSSSSSFSLSSRASVTARKGNDDNTILKSGQHSHVQSIVDIVEQRENDTSTIVTTIDRRHDIDTISELSINSSRSTVDITKIGGIVNTVVTEKDNVRSEDITTIPSTNIYINSFSIDSSHTTAETSDNLEDNAMLLEYDNFKRNSSLFNSTEDSVDCDMGDIYDCYQVR